ncbi:sialate O-acetylesterase [Caulobacter segnis]|uniref:sialate O-acetylesterase n=1 Tax=Caulobacter segnis TaxID=88688 RepID=UPI001CBD38EA|nr:sialate O-acetylesterase [Caulobacter segnis]UAL11550.1 sialate O-acetylesterase [Caulobacter segnis]
MRRLLLAACVAALITPLAATTAVAAKRPDVYLLTGQSNMSGRGLLEELTPEERLADPAIQLYGNDGVTRPALDPLDDPASQVDAVSTDVQAAVGPGLFFARTLRGLNGRPILLVPCAKGGSSIGQWTPSEARDTLYGSCLARVREVGGRVKGILWYQGESDAGRPDSAAGWREGFEALVGRFRSDLKAPRLPLVLVQLADPPSPEVSAPRTYPCWAAIQAVQAGPTPACVAMVPAQGLPLKADTLHLTTAGQRVLGGKLAEAMDGLRRRGCR